MAVVEVVPRRARPGRTVCSGLLALGLLAPAVSPAQIPEQDRRNTEIRHTDRHYAMSAYTRAEWESRAAFLRRQILFSAGLLPLPEKTPLNPRSGEPVLHDDYSVSAVLLETYPGFFLGGNLYRPAGKPGPFPAVVLCSGSGPQDRDSTIAGHKPFLVLADHLTRAGIAVLSAFQ